MAQGDKMDQPRVFLKTLRRNFVSPRKGTNLQKAFAKKAFLKLILFASTSTIRMSICTHDMILKCYLTHQWQAACLGHSSCKRNYQSRVKITKSVIGIRITSYSGRLHNGWEPTKLKCLKVTEPTTFGDLIPLYGELHIAYIISPLLSSSYALLTSRESLEVVESKKTPYYYMYVHSLSWIGRKICLGKLDCASVLSLLFVPFLLYNGEHYTLITLRLIPLFHERNNVKKQQLFWGEWSAGPHNHTATLSLTTIAFVQLWPGETVNYDFVGRKESDAFIMPECVHSAICNPKESSLPFSLRMVLCFLKANLSCAIFYEALEENKNKIVL